MKKGFINIYVLLILLTLGLTIGFIHRENESNYDITVDFYNKKVGLFEAESLLNIIIEESRIDDSKIKDKGEYFFYIVNSLDSKSDLSVHRGDVNNKVAEAKDAKGLKVKAEYKGTISQALVVYKVDENEKIKIIYKKVY